MECVQLNTVIQKGEIIKMPNGNNSNYSTRNSNSQSNTSNLNDTLIKLDTTIKWMKYIFGISIPIISVLFGWFAIQIHNLSSLSSIKTTVENIELGLNGDPSTNSKGIYTRLALIEDKLNINPISVSDNVVSSIQQVSIEQNDNIISTTSFVPDTYIGSDSSGKKYIAKDLVNEPVFLTYLEGNNEVYFLGQFNDNYNWDGFCVTNVYYPDGSLCGICESNFDGGKRLDYKSIFVSDNSTGNEWTYSEKMVDTDGNTGINITYNFNYDTIKNFTSTNSRISDIIYVLKLRT